MMAQDNVIIIKSESFADRISKMCRYLTQQHVAYKSIISQVLRSGTSIGANVAEGQFAQSKADFLTKMSIALKEANETRYWLKRLYADQAIDEPSFQSMLQENEEIISILVKITKTTKDNLNNGE